MQRLSEEIQTMLNLGMTRLAAMCVVDHLTWVEGDAILPMSAAAMALPPLSIQEWYKPGCSLGYPIHGTGVVVDALVCGLQKFGGRISFKSHVENIVVENGRAVGVKLRSGQVLWRAVERAVGPGFDREKCEVKLVGTPLTHRRFLQRNRGSYGPAIQAGKGTFPGHSTLIPQLYCCGDSTFPGIEVPAVAASGAIVANSLVSVSQHSELLDAVGI
ncbi:hypothetical protein HYC85_009879 [Camellia sinensis]|uniref:Amine oxidase domain-containing protein n=1 Tax=Camellia sinensis TaxID=4442 RepID=A0A7J7HH73_CAMSI|nr:hypothetical protein HYC85_009879 [Camellia sinensis]